MRRQFYHSVTVLGLIFTSLRMSQLELNVFSHSFVPGLLYANLTPQRNIKRVLQATASYSFQAVNRLTIGKYLMSAGSFFSIPSVSATDPDAICPLRPIACVECRSDLEAYCLDPFNRSLLTFNQIRTRICDGFCVKWIRASPTEEKENVIVRTCSSNLRIKLQINLVCFQESKADDRVLCFCNQPRCNSGRALKLPFFSHILYMILVPFVTSFFTPC
uniref:UPAR/Ly6 domain-containing protein qvr n=1 Tax=Schistocephalus solidus TaxID=70667 RepID=A0A0X3PF88_SCHSO